MRCNWGALMRDVLGEVAARGRVEVSVNTALGMLWALASTRFSGGQAVLQALVAVAYFAAAVLAFRKGRRLLSTVRGSAQPRSVFAHVASLDPLADLPRRGLALSLTGTAAFALGLLLAVTTPRAHGASIGAGALLAAGELLAALGPVLALQHLVAVTPTTATGE